MRTFKISALLLVLYLCVVACASQHSDPNSKGHLEALLTELELGIVHKTPSVHTYWIEVKNTGKGPLTIKDVRTSCFCTTVEWDKSPLQPRKTSKLKVVLDTSEMEPSELFVREIYIKSDADNPDVNVTMSGSITN